MYLLVWSHECCLHLGFSTWAYLSDKSSKKSNIFACMCLIVAFMSLMLHILSSMHLGISEHWFWKGWDFPRIKTIILWLLPSVLLCTLIWLIACISAYMCTSCMPLLQSSFERGKDFPRIKTWSYDCYLASYCAHWFLDCMHLCLHVYLMYASSLFLYNCDPIDRSFSCPASLLSGLQHYSHNFAHTSKSSGKWLESRGGKCMT